MERVHSYNPETACEQVNKVTSKRQENFINKGVNNELRNEELQAFSSNSTDLTFFIKEITSLVSQVILLHVNVTRHNGNANSWFPHCSLSAVTHAPPFICQC